MSSEVGVRVGGARTEADLAAGGSREQLRLVVRLWLVSRLLLAVVAVLAMLTQRRTLRQVLSAWDVAHFEAIARNGYAETIDRAFFPALPLLLRAAGQMGLPMYLSGAVLALGCSLLAALALLRLGGPVAAGLWLFAPTTVFTAVAYTEAPFCALAFWAWERATRGRWAQAALLAALASGFRISGLFLVGGLGLLALTRSGVPWSRRLVHAALAALGVVGVLAYFAWLHHLTGSWSAWFDAQAAGWNRGFYSPLDSLRHTLEAGAPSRWPDRPSVAWVFRAEVVSMLVGAVVTLVLLVRRRWAQAGYVGVQVFAFATSYWFMSVNRAVLLWFPLWLLVAELARRGWPGAQGREPGRGSLVARGLVLAFGVVSLAAAVWWAWLYFTGAWAS
ncbi:hypothetical protein [Luteococcus peritonei]|uniref:Glycosyltransferase RgtA/B/C/D-like domain-containing protein n=1 Tax=Luteococcus peritonei TaxID=88874 RepID=A0ABW4RYC5_9ACTN